MTRSLAHSPRGGELVPYIGVREGAGPGVGPEAGLRWLAHPFGGGVCRGHAQYPAFAPNPCFCSQLFRGGSWFSVFLYLVDHNLPQLCMHAVIFSPL